MKWRNRQSGQAKSREEDPVLMENDETAIDEEAATILIAGGGLVGLVLALALNKQIGVKAEIYEQATSFQDGIGNGIGMYPNGLRVIRAISPDLLAKVQQAGYPYLCRRWERHDGTEIIKAAESALSNDDGLQPMGIRRWRLQKLLHEEIRAQGITIHFRKKITALDHLKSGKTVVHFEDNTSRATSLLLAADGAKSPIRNLVAGETSKLTYTGTTCLYGSAELARAERGICFPSSVTTNCHGCFYPTGPQEQCFQFHIPTDPKTKEEGGWRALASGVGKEACKKLAVELEKDGWDEKYLGPLNHASHAINVPFAVLDPPLQTFAYGRVVLVGDSAHPPVPYLGQGAQQGLEDAGTLSFILKRICLDSCGNFSMLHIDQALSLYSEIRVPRTNEILNHSHGWGDVQQKRAKNERFSEVKEEIIRRDVFFNESIHQILPGVTYDYEEEVINILQSKPLLVAVPEEAVY